MAEKKKRAAGERKLVVNIDTGWTDFAGKFHKLDSSYTYREPELELDELPEKPGADATDAQHKAYEVAVDAREQATADHETLIEDEHEELDALIEKRHLVEPETLKQEDEAVREAKARAREKPPEPEPAKKKGKE